MLAALGASIIILYSPEAEVGVTDYAQDFLVTRVKLSNAILCSALLVFWHFCFKACGLYESYRLRKTGDAVPNILKAVAWSSMALIVAAQLGSWKTITLLTVLLFAICATAGTLSPDLRRRGAWNGHDSAARI